MSSTCFFFADASLRNYLTMVDFLMNKKVCRGYVALNMKRNEVVMAAVCDEIDPTVFLECECVKFHSNKDDNNENNREALDQELSLDDALRVSALDADQVQTKRMKKIKQLGKRRSHPSHTESPLPPPVFPPSPSSPSTPEQEFIG